MNSNRLEAILNQLHEELQHADQLQPEQADHLRSMAAEIQQRLDRQDPQEGFIERLRDFEKQFEASHPRLTNTVGQLADILAQMGI